MNNKHGTADSHHPALGKQSISLGAAVKERQRSRGVHVSPETHEVEYEFGNGESDALDDEGGPVSEDAPSGRKLIMVYDEHGKATPVPMGRFYYDSVQSENKDDEGTARDAYTKGQGVNASARSNTFTAPLNKSQAVAGGHTGGLSVPGNNAAVETRASTEEGAYVEDAEDHEYEDDDDDVETDPFKNQFMRISIPAAQLKDVSRVKKDLDHDKVQRRRSLRVGLQRAVSTVKIADGGRAKVDHGTPLVSRQSSAARVSARNLKRSMSFAKDKKSNPEVNHVTEKKASEPENTSLLERSRESTAIKPAKRQGLGVAGRLMSRNRNRNTGEYSDDSQAPKNLDRDRPIGLSSKTSTLAPSQTFTFGTSKNVKRSGLAQAGRLFSRSRKNPDQASSSPVSNMTEVDKQLESESVVSDRSVDRDRPEVQSEKQGVAPGRMALSKMGRIMSLRSRKSVNHQQSDAVSERNIEKGASKKTHLSPLSSSTLSSNPLDSSLTERDRNSHNSERTRPPGNSSRKEATRMGLRAAGRLLSFSRKPTTSGDALNARTASSQKDGRVEQVDAANRTHLGRRGNDHEDPSKKLDGRANKFFYSEISSERIRRSRTLGSETHIRVPVIAMAEYSGPVSRTKWYIDGFTLPHNAVRRECIDLYEILTSLARCMGARDITRDDIEDFEDWWRTATSFFKCYFDMERTILFPWVDAAGSSDEEVQLALSKMRSLKDRLQEHLVKVDYVWNEKLSRDPGEMFALLYKAVDLFVPRLMNYFADQEVLLPTIVKGFYKLEDRMKMDKEMVNAFMGGSPTRKSKEDDHHNLILLIRWIGNPRQLRAWIGKNLNSNARALYGNWYDLYQEQHYRFVKTLRNRSKVMLAAVP